MARLIIQRDANKMSNTNFTHAACSYCLGGTPAVCPKRLTGITFKDHGGRLNSLLVAE